MAPTVGPVCHARSVDRIVRVVLEGQEASPGRVPATDVARLLLGVQAALRRAAHVVLGRPRLATTGRYEAAIEEATRLRFVRVEDGSFAGVLALPDPESAAEELGLDVSLQGLGYHAFHRLLDVIEERPTDVDQGLARAIAQLAEDVNVGGRTTRIRLETMAHDQRSLRAAVIDEVTRYAMQAAANQPEPRPDVVHGRLVEADFEKNQARLRQPTGEAVNVTFGDELADDIQAALREPNTFVGDVTYNRQTGHASQVALRRVVGPGEQLTLPGLQFYRHRTVAELAAEQGLGEPQDLDSIRARTVDDDELAAFVAAAEQL
jgi:hypothetical protein